MIDYQHILRTVKKNNGFDLLQQLQQQYPHLDDEALVFIGLHPHEIHITK